MEEWSVLVHSNASSLYYHLILSLSKCDTHGSVFEMPTDILSDI